MREKEPLDKQPTNQLPVRSQSKFYYVRGVLGDPRLIKEHIETIKRLRKGDFSEADLEKLKGVEAIYSYRINKKKRLLFTFITINGEEYPVILDYLPTHNYHNSPFLRPGFLKRYLENQKEVFKELIEKESETPDGLDEEPSFEPCSAAELSARLASLTLEDDNECELGVLEYYEENLIELSPTQQQILKIKLPGPALVGGVAGSGKSCGAFTLLIAYITAMQQRAQQDNNPEKLDQADNRKKKTIKVLYVTQSEFLVKSMEEAWENLPLAREKEDVQLEFKTYRQLLEHLEQGGLEPAGVETFTGWYKQYVKKAKKAAHTRGEAPPPELDSKTAYQECRIRSGYSPKDYLDLGKKQSQLQRQERSWLNKVYSDYLKNLAKENQFAPEFSPLALKDYYDLITVDEAQDFSPGQLISLSLAAKKGAIVYFTDSHQQLFDERSIRSFILKKLHIAQENHIELTVMHRCPPKVQASANEVIAFKHRLVGGIADPDEPTKIEKTLYAENSQGHVYLLDMNMLDACTWMREQPLGSDFVVVTLEGQQEEAKKHFNTQLILTPEQIKGQEKEFVVAYRLFPPTLFKEAQQRLHERGETKQPIHQAKSAHRDDHYIRELNRIYTAFTRAKHALVIVEKFTPENEILLRHLRPIADKGLPSKEGLKLANQEDWQQEAAKQKAAGNLAVAAAIEQAIQPQHQTNSNPTDETKRAGKKGGNKNVATPTTGKKGTGKKAAATPTKKEQQPRPRSVQAVTTTPSVKSPEMANAIILYGKFDEKRFALALRNLKVASLLLTKYQTSTDTFVLLEKLIEEDKIKILLRLAANNIHILLNIPFNQLFKFIDKNKSDAHREAYNSFLKMSLIRTDMEKIKLEADMVKHYITYQENCPPLPSFKEEQASVVELCSYIKEESCTPAHLDIVGGDCKHLTTLHAMGADLNRTDVQGKTPTYWLSILGKTKELRLFKTWGGVDFEAGSHRLTPANGAARSGNVTVLKLLKEWGVQLDKPDQPTGCPIHTAAFHGDISLLKKFHAWGLKMDVLDADGNPPIYLATINEKYEVLKLFNNLGIKLDTLCKDGSTIVHGAADKGDLQALELFHQWKIPLNTLNALGNAPIHYAVRYVEILKAFKSWEENLDIQTENGATLMYAAADNGFLGTVKFLIKHNPHQAKIPALFPAKHFMESICTRYDDNGIQRRAFDKLNERSLAGDPDSSIQILPIDIAEIMGYSDIVAELTKLTPKETLTPRANFSPGFLKPEKKRSKGKVESKDESSHSTEKEEAQFAVNSSMATEGYFPTFFNSSTKSKDTNLPKTPAIPVVKRSI